MGRVQVVSINSDQSVVFWLKSKNKDSAEIYARRIHQDGRRGPLISVTEVASIRGVGFPQVEKVENEIFVVWTEEAKTEPKAKSLRLVRFNVGDIPPVSKHDIQLAKIDGVSREDNISQFTAKDIAGKTVALADFKGKNILLNFWASWCDTCIDEFGLINELKKKYSSKGLKIILVNVDESSDWPKAEKIIKQAKLASTVWRNTADQTTGQFGYSALPHTVLLDSGLKVKGSFSGSLVGKKDLIENQISNLLK